MGHTYSYLHMYYTYVPAIGMGTRIYVHAYGDEESRKLVETKADLPVYVCCLIYDDDDARIYACLCHSCQPLSDLHMTHVRVCSMHVRFEIESDVCA